MNTAVFSKSEAKKTPDKSVPGSFLVENLISFNAWPMILQSRERGVYLWK